MVLVNGSALSFVCGWYVRSISAQGDSLMVRLKSRMTSFSVWSFEDLAFIYSSRRYNGIAKKVGIVGGKRNSGIVVIKRNGKVW